MSNDSPGIYSSALLNQPSTSGYQTSINHQRSQDYRPSIPPYYQTTSDNRHPINQVSLNDIANQVPFSQIVNQVSLNDIANQVPFSQIVNQIASQVPFNQVATQVPFNQVANQITTQVPLNHQLRPNNRSQINQIANHIAQNSYGNRKRLPDHRQDNIYHKRQRHIRTCRQINRDICRLTSARGIVHFSLQYIHLFNHVNLATSLHRFAKNGGRLCVDAISSKYLSHITQRIIVKINSMRAQEVANTLWALATLHYSDHAIINILLSRIPYIVNSMNNQAIANSLWALAKLNNRNKQIMRILISRIPYIVHLMTSQEVTNSLWALAKMRHRDAGMVTILLTHINHIVSDMKSQEVANILWALATLHHLKPDIINTISNCIPTVVNNMNAQEISNSLWALAKLNYYDAHVINTLFNRIPHVVKDMKNQYIANTLWALAKLSDHDQEIIHILLDHLPDIVKDMNCQEISNTLWALAILNHYDKACVELLIAHLHYDGQLESSRQLIQLYIHAKIYEWPIIDQLSDKISILLTDKSIVREIVNSSSLHNNISAVLTELSIQHQNEAYVQDWLVVDIYLEKDNKVIEVNGPSHYLNDGRLNGSSKWKFNILSKCGYEVIIIDYRKWNSSNNKIQYIKEVLAI